MNSYDIKQLLAYLREQIINECISYREIEQLQELKDYIDPSDVLLLEWAGVPEFVEHCPNCLKEVEYGAETCKNCLTKL